jgi:hypothetical protein
MNEAGKLANIRIRDIIGTLGIYLVFCYFLFCSVALVDYYSIIPLPLSLHQRSKIHQSMSRMYLQVERFSEIATALRPKIIHSFEFVIDQQVK